MPFRLKLLVVAHVLLSVIGVAQFRLLFDVLWLPVVTSISSVAIAQSMLVGFWIGLGGGRHWVRALAWIAASAYLGIWPAAAIQWLPPDATTDDTTFWNGFLPAAAVFSVAIALFAAIYGVIRWRFAEFRQTSTDNLCAGPAQFTILHMLVITTVASLVLAMSRAALFTSLDSIWNTAAVYALVLISFIITVVAAPWAMFRAGAMWRRLLVVFASAIATGLAVSFVFYYRMQLPQGWQWWWIFLGQAFAISLVPLLVFMVSLAVVRSCGYRLVGKRPAAGSASPVSPLQFDGPPLNSRSVERG